MAQSKTVKKKAAISGFIHPRWPKDRVVKWLTIGAYPTILGVWFPDWLGAYSTGTSFVIPPLLPALPPFLTYIGALLLLKATWEGIRDMGWHFRGLQIAGILCVLSAGLSLGLVLLGFKLASLAAVELAFYFGVGFMWFTTLKVGEISQEHRTKITALLILIFDNITLFIHIAGLVFLGLEKTTGGFLILRLWAVSQTITFFLCVYSVHCYKTQTSIGAKFAVSPDEQFWVSAGG
ncbi:hypothetical protein FACS189445_5340 [Spirochaetia bacterium]|nr:hypothetical protein FACS189445_5340 [Spirochaetia bacterium]